MGRLRSPQKPPSRPLPRAKHLASPFIVVDRQALPHQPTAMRTPSLPLASALLLSCVAAASKLPLDCVYGRPAERCNEPIGAITAVVPGSLYFAKLPCLDCKVDHRMYTQNESALVRPHPSSPWKLKLTRAVLQHHAFARTQPHSPQQPAHLPLARHLAASAVHTNKSGSAKLLACEPRGGYPLQGDAHRLLAI